jgi:DNA (cytosine-5)-methyltransferase 1
MKLKLLDLFSGIGGFSLGLESTGYFETIAFVEKDKFCQQVLKKNFKDIPIESEVRNVKGERYEADIITGGFPCQPFSVAGKRRGTDDDRYLWDETIRIIRECKPRWFIGENVEGIINIQDGLVLRQVQDDLEKEGFQVQCLVIPASGIGAWHQRKRVWIIAQNPNNSRCKDRTKQYRRQQTQNEKGINSSSRSNTVSKQHKTENVSNTKCIKLHRCSDASRVGGGKLKRMDSNEKENREEVWSKAERCSEQDKRETWWEAQCRICGIPNGVSFSVDKNRSNRIKSLGNSIVPLIARELGLAIMKAEQDG